MCTKAQYKDEYVQGTWIPMYMQDGRECTCCHWDTKKNILVSIKILYWRSNGQSYVWRTSVGRYLEIRVKYGHISLSIGACLPYPRLQLTQSTSRQQTPIYLSWPPNCKASNVFPPPSKTYSYTPKRRSLMPANLSHRGLPRQSSWQTTCLHTSRLKIHPLKPKQFNGIATFYSTKTMK